MLTGLLQDHRTSNVSLVAVVQNQNQRIQILIKEAIKPLKPLHVIRTAETANI